MSPEFDPDEVTITPVVPRLRDKTMKVRGFLIEGYGRRLELWTGDGMIPFVVYDVDESGIPGKFLHAEGLLSAQLRVIEMLKQPWKE